MRGSDHGALTVTRTRPGWRATPRDLPPGPLAPPAPRSWGRRWGSPRGSARSRRSRCSTTDRPTTRWTSGEACGSADERCCHSPGTASPRRRGRGRPRRSRRSERGLGRADLLGPRPVGPTRAASGETAPGAQSGTEDEPSWTARPLTKQMTALRFLERPSAAARSERFGPTAFAPTGVTGSTCGAPAPAPAPARASGTPRSWGGTSRPPARSLAVA